MVGNGLGGVGKKEAEGVREGVGERVEVGEGKEGFWRGATVGIRGWGRVGRKAGDPERIRGGGTGGSR